MKRGHLSALLMVTGCLGGTDPIETITPITELSPIERCLVEGGTLRELWSANNQHGPVQSIAVEGSTIVLGSADGSVKQWSASGASPSYGTPFTDDTGIGVGAVAFTGDGAIASGDAGGRVSEWRVSDAEPMRSTPVTKFPVVAIAADAELVAIALGNDTPTMFAVTRATGVAVELDTYLWGASAVAFTPNALFTAGHDYTTPSIERRDRATPTRVVERWTDNDNEAPVLSIAVDRASTQLAVGGDGFVAALDPQDLASGPRAFTPAPGHQAIGTVLLGRELFATAGREGTLRVWSRDAERLRTLAIAAPVGLGIDGAGATLFTSGGDGVLHAYGCR